MVNGNGVVILIDELSGERLGDLRNIPFLMMCDDFSNQRSEDKIIFLVPGDKMKRTYQFDHLMETVSLEVKAELEYGRMPNDFEKFFDPGTVEGIYIKAFLDTSRSMKVDIVVSGDEHILSFRHELLQRYLIRVMPFEELPSTIEMVSVGRGYFLTEQSIVGLSIDGYYTLTNTNSQELQKFKSEVDDQLNQKTREILRSLIYNRYNFILYARDMVKYSEILRDRSLRYSGREEHALSIGYHLSSFHVHLWGALDLLMLFIKEHKGLQLPDAQCSISPKQKRFRNELRVAHEGILKVLESKRIDEWLTRLSEFRHPAAHSRITMPTNILSKSEESEKSDDEIRNILKKEQPELYSLRDQIKALLEPQAIAFWRIKKMNRVARNMVYIEKKSKSYFYDPIAAVDVELNMANEILSAVFDDLFSCELKFDTKNMILK